jgi:hypothetical protein
LEEFEFLSVALDLSLHLFSVSHGNESTNETVMKIEGII